MTFTGVAMYDIQAEIAKDVSPIVSMISPASVPFLDFIGDQSLPIFGKSYSWDQKYLLPETFATSSAIASTAAASGGIEFGANADLLRVGDVLRNRNNNEMIYVSSIGTSAATIYVTRAYAGTTATSLAAGQTLDFLYSAIEEGSGPRSQRRRGKASLTNYAQTFREDIVISNLANNTVMEWQMAQSGRNGSYVSPYFEELTDKTKEVLIQLERAVLMGRTNGNTMGADDAETTMAGIYNSITATNIISHATYTNSIVNAAIATIHNFTDVRDNADKYVMVCGDIAYRRVSNSREASVQRSATGNDPGLALPDMFLSDFGPMRLMPSRRVPTGSIMVLRKDFIKVRPYVGNSFQTRQYDDGTAAQKGYVEGTYGLEFHQLEAHARLDGLT